MDLTDKRIIVTGGAGIIGKELIKKLHKKNSNIYCVDRVPQPLQIGYLQNYIQKDLNHMKEDEIIDIDPYIIFHLAAFIAIPCF